jgi:arylsulfatase A-like enzyme
MLLGALVAGLTPLAGNSRPGGETATGVVLITLDTTRADRLTPYGLMDAAMPGLERLAREGVLFQQAASVAPLTLPAHTSIMTGLLPPRHGVRDNVDRPLAPSHRTLAEMLHDRGFRTAAFVGSTVVGADRGLARGFEHYGDVPPNDRAGVEGRQRRADEVVGDALQWLDAIGDSPFFLWTHLYDPHRPYNPPAALRTRHLDPYIGEIAFADAQIARLLDALDTRRLLDRVLVIVTADHGESLGDHGEQDHGMLLYESVLRVPLIVRGPGLRPGHVEGLVRLVDIMPTVLDVLGFGLTPTDGVSLRDALRGAGVPRDLEAYAESLYPQRLGGSPVRSLRVGRFKLIDAPCLQLYDLDRDPFEEHNVYLERPTLADGLSRRVEEIDAGGALAQSGHGLQADVPAELQERLAALGYVGSGGSTMGSRSRVQSSGFAVRGSGFMGSCRSREVIEP